MFICKDNYVQGKLSFNYIQVLEFKWLTSEKEEKGARDHKYVKKEVIPLKTKRLFLFTAILLLFPVLAAAQMINGGFEDNYTGWTSTGNTGIASIATIAGEIFLPYSGDKMGAITYPSTTGFIWENSLSQSVVLGPDDNYLVFYYNFWTLDEAPFDSPGFTVQVNGTEVFSTSAGDIGDGTVGTLDYTGWREFCYDVSGFYSEEPRLFTLQLQFNAGNTGDNQYPSGVFLDEVRLQANPTPIPPTLLMLASGLVGLIGFRCRRAWYLAGHQNLISADC